MGMMEYAQSIMIENVKNGVLRKFPLLGTTMSQLDFVPDYNRKTAATDGENVFWSPKFFEELSYDQKVFVVAHEVMHVAFNHLIRRQDKDRKIWNKATDAVINQMLFAKGLPKIDRIIDLKDAIDKSSEYMYERLLKEKEERKSQKMNRDKSQGQGGDGEPIDSDEFDDDEDEFDAHASHDEWDEVFKKIENENESEGDMSDDSTEEENKKTFPKADIFEDEKEFTKANDKLKENIGKKIRDDLENKKNEISSGRGGYVSKFDGVGESKAVLSWKKILKRTLEVEQDRWSYRRADEDNFYQARIGSFDIEDYPETEVFLDVSGSVSNDFLKGFLRQLKPLLKESSLKVGCFDEFVYPMVEIKSNKDIDKFAVTRTSTWTENWDGAVRAFSKDKGVNKIIFTDGYPCPGVMPKNDLKNVNVIWLVFGNKNFKPCCGKVIYINKSELNFEIEESGMIM